MKLLGLMIRMAVFMLARDIKVVETHLTSETFKSSVKCVVRTHLTEDVKCFCLIYRFYIIDVKAVLRRL